MVRRRSKAQPGVQGLGKLALGLACLLPLGCGEGFDPPNEVKSLRVFGVHKNASYAQPGDEVTMNLVWGDASSEAPRDVSIAWMPPCFNPPGGLYYGCFAQYASGEAAGIGSLSQEFRFRLPDDLLSSRPSPDPGNPLFGVAYAFFTVCAGELTVLDAPPSKNALPLACRDRETGELLGPKDFMAGYTAVYSYADGYTNQNPIVSGFQVEGVEIPTECLGVDCSLGGDVDEDAEPETFDCSDPEVAPRCIATCEDDGELECPDIDIAPIIDPASAEHDQLSQDYFDRNVGEQLWINYYADRGGMRSPVRLLNDATEGWNDEFGVEFWAPKEPGPLSIWAVVHDNRGGAEFVRVKLYAENR